MAADSTRTESADAASGAGPPQARHAATSGGEASTSLNDQTSRLSAGAALLHPDGRLIKAEPGFLALIDAIYGPCEPSATGSLFDRLRHCQDDVRLIESAMRCAISKGTVFRGECELGLASPGLQRVELLIYPASPAAAAPAKAPPSSPGPTDPSPDAAASVVTPPPSVSHDGHGPTREPEATTVRMELRLMAPARPGLSQDPLAWPAMVEPSPGPALRASGDGSLRPEVTSRRVVLMDDALRVLDRARELENRNRELRTATEAGGIGLWAFDFRSNTASWSARALDILGNPQPPPASLEDVLAIIPEADRPLVIETVERQRHARRDPRIALSHRILRADGSIRWVSVRGEIIDWSEDDELSGDSRRPTRSAGIIVDITDRKRSEWDRNQQLRELQQKHRRLVEVFKEAPFFILTTHGPEHEVQIANPAFHRMLRGVAPEGRPLGDVLADLCDAELRASILDVYRTGQTLHREEVTFHRNRAPDPGDTADETCIVNLVVQPLHDADARITGLNVHGVDVTREVRARRRLQESEERLELAMAAANAGLWDLMLNPENPHVILSTYLSPRFKEIIGYGPDEFPDSIPAFRARIHPDDIAAINTAADAYRDGISPRYEVAYRVRHRDGRFRWVRSTGRIYRDSAGRAFRWTGITADVTDQKQAELELRRSERFYRTIGEAIPYGIWSCDAEGRLTYVSDAFLNLLGRRFEDVRDYGWANCLTEDLVEPTLAGWRECCASGVDWERMLRYRGADGQAHHILSRGRPVRDAAGRIEAWVGINLDMSTHMATQAALLASERHRNRHLAEIASIYGSAPVGLCFLDRDLRYVSINERLAQINGRPVADHLGRTLREIRPDVAPLVEPLLRRAVESGEPVFDHEIAFPPNETGEWTRHWLVTCDPVVETTGEVIGVNTVLHDVSGIRRAERALAESESRFRLAIDAARAMVYASEMRSAQFLWMHGAECLVGTSPTLPCDREWWRSRVHPDDLARVEATIASATRSRQDYMIEYRVRHERGHEVHVEEHTTIVVDDRQEPIRHVGVVIDVTSRRQAEDALRENESNFRRAVMTSPFPTIIHSEDGRVVLVNDAFVEGSGYSAAELQTMEDWIVRAYRDRHDEIRDALHRLYRSEAPSRDGDFRIRTAGGADRLWAFSSTPMGRDRNGNRVVLSVAADLTDRVHAQRRAELLTAELNHRVKNTLATVLSICRQTGRHADSYERFRDAFEGRLLALAQAHSLLSAENWTGINLRDLVFSALEPFSGPHGSGFVTRGPRVAIHARLALTLTLALHELATNAAKYGALSMPEGVVHVDWRVLPPEAPATAATIPANEAVIGVTTPDRRRPETMTPDPDGTLEMTWVERGGPRVRPPVRRGLGSRLLERTIQYEFSGSVQLHYEPEGVRCLIQVPLDQRQHPHVADPGPGDAPHQSAT